ncbi:MAG: hypothetical protein HQ483_01300 [Rhodospirillales bacterium]|nr:hypothetical protein [Rhodospirillales bacterium]
MAFSIGLAVLAIAIGLTALWSVTEITKKVLSQTKEMLDGQKMELLRVSKSFDDSLRTLRGELRELSDENIELRRELRTEWKAQSLELARIRVFVDEFEAAWKRQKEITNLR